MSTNVPKNMWTWLETQVLESVYCREKETGESYDYQTLEDWYEDDWFDPDHEVSALFDQMEDNGVIRSHGNDKEMFITLKGVDRLKLLRKEGLGTPCISDFDQFDCFCQMY